MIYLTLIFSISIVFVIVFNWWLSCTKNGRNWLKEL